MRIGNEFFQEIFEKATSPKSSGAEYCNTNTTNICALIDQNGYIVSSNQGERYIGRFIGDVSSILIEKLAESGIFSKIMIEDTQSECPLPPQESKGSSINLLTPFTFLYQIFQGMIFALQTLSWITVQYSSIFLFSTEGHAETDKPIKVSCTLQMPFYVFQTSLYRENYADKHKWIKCDEACNLIYYLKEVKDTNLLFLYAKSTTQCKSKCIKPDKNLAHRKSFNIENRVCKEKARYRRKPGKCYNEDIPNEHLVCGGSKEIKPTLFIVSVLFTILYLRFNND